jgi:UDPglucose 6-dehydrogenase
VKICVIGSGYVGLVTAAVFSDLGNEVHAVDVDPAKIALLNTGRMPIYEPGLEEMVGRNRSEGRIDFSTDVAGGIRRAEIVFICVGTPPEEDGRTDLTYVHAAAKTIGENLNGYKIVVNKSTVPVGTGDLVTNVIRAAAGADAAFDVVSNPEFLREGQAIGDALHPDRIIIGAPNHHVAGKFQELYEPLDAVAIVTDVASAELIKYASNAFLATKISFANALADLCEATGADILDVARGVGADKRIGSEFLHAGLGYGGSCFPKDVLSLIHTSKERQVDFALLDQVVQINAGRAGRFVRKAVDHFGDLSGLTVGVLGLAFKPDTDDMREAKSIEIIELLTDLGATVRAYDPVATENARAIIDKPVAYCSSAYEAAEGADGLMLVTEWREFKLLDMDRIKRLMKQPVLFDGRNVYNPERERTAGFTYYSVGRR